MLFSFPKNRKNVLKIFKTNYSLWPLKSILHCYLHLGSNKVAGALKAEKGTKESPLTGRLRRRQWHPTPVLLPGKSHGWRSLEGCSPWGCWGLDTTEWLPFHFSLSCIGEGNGNPLQCSCLENPRDSRAWWAAVYEVTQSWTRLKWISSSNSNSSSSKGWYLVVVVKSLSGVWLFYDFVDCSLPVSSVLEISQARILGWVVLPFLGDLPNLRIKSTSPTLTGRVFTTEPPM